MPNPFLALFAYALIALCAVLAWLLVRRSSFNNRCYLCGSELKWSGYYNEKSHCSNPKCETHKWRREALAKSLGESTKGESNH